MTHFIGIDFHKQFSSVAVMDEHGVVMDQCRLLHNRPEELMSYFSQFSKDTSVTLEATRHWYWLVDLLQEQGFNVKLAHAKKVRIIAESTIKTDTIDARVLAHLDRCNFLPQAYIASSTIRHERELLRYHMSLVKIQTALKNKIHAILSKHNIEHGFSDLFGKEGIPFLKNISLPPMFRYELDGYLDLLEHLKSTLSDAKKQISKHCRVWPEARLLTTIPGIAQLSALLLAAEIADIKRFASSNKLCCYAGLVASTHQSGSKEYHGRIIKDSNKYIRFVLLEAVPHAVKKDPKLWRFYSKMYKLKGSGKAKVATARKLLVAIYHMLKNNTPYQIEYGSYLKRQVNPASGLGA